MNISHSYKNLRDEITMDMDVDDEGTQRPRRVNDYGLEVDFSGLDEEEKEVNHQFLYRSVF